MGFAGGAAQALAYLGKASGEANETTSSGGEPSGNFFNKDPAPEEACDNADEAQHTEDESRNTRNGVET